jgi:hypothetical protein
MYRSRRVSVLLLAAFALTAAACGGSDSSSGATTATAAATNGATASDADVATGLAQMVTVAAEAAAKTVTDAAAGKTAAAGLETRWAPIEDVVKANEPDTYIDIEDAMALLESGDAGKAADGAARITTAVTGYVVKHPG